MTAWADRRDRRRADSSESRGIVRHRSVRVIDQSESLIGPCLPPVRVRPPPAPGRRIDRHRSITRHSPTRRRPATDQSIESSISPSPISHPSLHHPPPHTHTRTRAVGPRPTDPSLISQSVTTNPSLISLSQTNPSLISLTQTNPSLISLSQTNPSLISQSTLKSSSLIRQSTPTRPSLIRPSRH